MPAPQTERYAVRCGQALAVVTAGVKQTAMKSVRDVIRRAPVWVNPEHTIDSAIVLMRGHNLSGLAVVDAGRLVGMVSTTDLLGADSQQPVSAVMATDVPALSPDTSVREAAAAMAESGYARLPVVEDERLIGVITSHDLLPELGRSFDPLTELPWSDGLREWAIEHLQSGAEVTVLFIDLDRFGLFNKRFGHIVGDTVLKGVAEALVEVTEPQIDFVCRYGGDEFCVATLRTAEAASDLASAIQQRVSAIQVPELRRERITCSVGQRGGRRTREREHVHYAATLNNLINLASQACIAQKNEAVADITPGVAVVRDVLIEPEVRVRLTRIEVQFHEQRASVLVELERAIQGLVTAAAAAAAGDGVERYSATTSAETDEKGVLRLVAETTVNALRSVLPPGSEITLSDVILNSMTNGQTLITSVGQIAIEGRATPVAGSAVIGDDPYRAAAASVLAAMNRSLSLLLSRMGR